MSATSRLPAASNAIKRGARKPAPIRLTENPDGANTSCGATLKPEGTATEVATRSVAFAAVAALLAKNAVAPLDGWSSCAAATNDTTATSAASAKTSDAYRRFTAGV